MHDRPHKKKRKHSSKHDVPARLISGKDLDRHVSRDKELTPVERLAIKQYIKNDGRIGLVAKNMGVSRHTVNALLKQPHIRKRIKRVFRKLGLNLTTVLGVVKHVMLKPGDFHYDFNRLKSVDMYLKLVEGYAPIKFSGKVKTEGDNPQEVKTTLFQLIKVLQDEKVESKIHKLK